MPVGGSVEGFYGKIPSRGDFVGAGLPRAFVEPWDAWLSAGMAASQAALGEGWVDVWLEAPIWHFALPAGVCGPLAAFGVWLPSVDRAGRHFPLTLVALDCDIGDAGSFLGRAEAAGLATLERDLTPEALLAMLAEPAAAVALPEDAEAGVWWTEGSPRLAACVRREALPQPERFADMLCPDEEIG